MAPEYVTRGNYSVKSDAFSFGVIVLEIVTGRKNNDSRGSLEHGKYKLNSWNSPLVPLFNVGSWLRTNVLQVWEHWEAGTVMELVDPSMNGSVPEGDLLRCFHIGLLCVQADPAVRPVMSSVVMMLGSDTVALEASAKPAFVARKGGPNATGVSTVSLQG
jgi:serine/threonine protein kinase